MMVTFALLAKCLALLATPFIALASVLPASEPASAIQPVDRNVSLEMGTHATRGDLSEPDDQPHHLDAGLDRSEIATPATQSSALSERGNFAGRLCVPVPGEDWQKTFCDEVWTGIFCLNGYNPPNHDLFIPPDCTRLACYGVSSIWVCNGIVGVGVWISSLHAAAMAIDITTNCESLFANDPYCITGGQQFDLDGYNIIVRRDDCSEGDRPITGCTDGPEQRRSAPAVQLAARGQSGQLASVSAREDFPDPLCIPIAGQDWELADYYPIMSSIKYLRNKAIELIINPGCVPLTCALGSSIWICSDLSNSVQLYSGHLADIAENIANKCNHPAPEMGFVALTGGQQFDSGGYNIIVRFDEGCYGATLPGSKRDES